MPCFYTGSEIGDLRMQINENSKIVHEEKLNMQAQVTTIQIELDKTTRLLCATMKRLANAGRLKVFADEETRKWWNEHKRADAKKE